MAFNFTLPLRVAQAIITIIVLGLTAYVASDWSGSSRWSGSWSPSSINFLLFTSVWTILALAYLLVAPVRFERLAHKFGILAVEAVTMIFWFAGWIAVASLMGDLGCGSHWGPCRAAIAAAVFGAFEWLLFLATTIMAALHVWRTRGSHTGKHDPAMEVHTTA